MQSGNANARMKQAIAKHLPWTASAAEEADSKLLYLRPRRAQPHPRARFLRDLTALGFGVAGVLLGFGAAFAAGHGELGLLSALIVGFVLGGTAAGFLAYRQLRRARVTADGFRQRLTSVERNQALWVSLSAVLHDVRNPLHNITLLLEALDSPGNDQVRVREQINTELERINARMRRVTQQVGEFSGEIQRRPVALGEVVKEVEVLLEPFARQSSVSIDIETPDEVRVVADPKLLAQALDHLMLNSLQILSQRDDRQHRLALWASVEERVVSLWIEDTGPGLPEPVQQHLFEPLSRRGANGLGLGLTIAHALTSAAGGELMLASTGEAGTQFCLRLERA